MIMSNAAQAASPPQAGSSQDKQVEAVLLTAAKVVGAIGGVASTAYAFLKKAPDTTEYFNDRWREGCKEVNSTCGTSLNTAECEKLFDSKVWKENSRSPFSYMFGKFSDPVAKTSSNIFSKSGALATEDLTDLLVITTGIGIASGTTCFANSMDNLIPAVLAGIIVVDGIGLMAYSASGGFFGDLKKDTLSALPLNFNFAHPICKEARAIEDITAEDAMARKLPLPHFSAVDRLAVGTLVEGTVLTTASATPSLAAETTLATGGEFAWATRGLVGAVGSLFLFAVDGAVRYQENPPPAGSTDLEKGAYFVEQMGASIKDSLDQTAQPTLYDMCKSNPTPECRKRFGHSISFL